MRVKGKCSWFGGPLDRGVGPEEGLSLYSKYEQAPHLFLDNQPIGTSGLARRLNPQVNYVACRWDLEETPAEMLRKGMAIVRAVKTNNVILCFPVDWGPAESTGRVADLSLGAMRRLKITTDDVIELVFPSTEGLTS